MTVDTDGEADADAVIEIVAVPEDAEVEEASAEEPAEEASAEELTDDVAADADEVAAEDSEGEPEKQD